LSLAAGQEKKKLGKRRWALLPGHDTTKRTRNLED